MTIKSLQKSLTNNVFYRSMLAGNKPFGLSSYWISLLGGTRQDNGFGVATDSGNNVYTFGFTDVLGVGDHFLLVKQDSAGAVQWQRTLTGDSTETGHGVAVDSGDNVYVVGKSASSGGNNDDFLLAKYNSAGTIQWQRSLGGGTTDRGYGIAVDSNDYVYVTGFSNSTGAGAGDFLLAKYDSSGTIQFQRTLGSTAYDEARAVAIDSSDNVYVLGITYSITNGDALLAKYNSSGTLQWQRSLGGASTDVGRGVAIDSSDNVYAFGYTISEGTGSNDYLLAKYNSSGTLQWQKILGGVSSEKGIAVAIDSSDNVYVNGETSSLGAGSRDFLIAKYDSSGTVQWQRTLGTAGYEVGNSITIDSQGSILVLGETEGVGSGNKDFLLAKLPSDGSLTGTYVLDGVDVVYSASAATAATSTLTAATSTLTGATSTLTAATTTHTDASASFTSYLVEL
tara:strand:+ start:918 stop:2273 length:1356 start_codon:yes stop_codon:yes gene_type:complete